MLQSTSCFIRQTTYVSHMSLSALQKFFLPPIIASCGVFSLMSFPLAALGEKQIAIRFQEEPIFYGKLRDVAIPYVILSTTISLGAGISAAAVCGWRHSSRKSAKYEQELSHLEQNLQEKEALLKELKQSESRLQVSGLKAFLDDEVPLDSTLLANNVPTTFSQPVVVQTPPVIHDQPVQTVPHFVTQQNATKTVGTVAATSKFASAQTFLSYAQTNTNNQEEAVTTNAVNKTTITATEVEELQKQLREMMLQMQKMQHNLQGIPQTTNAAPKAADKFQIYYDISSNHPV
ncbi:kinetochore protein SPC24 [Tolypothrix sp. FACHB-123]|uniref:kinetochore protein SPC24 n=1 Tax=Tolypothrix sp. FACHB-123 TaxID=2692868 RepID=UPI001F558883|nr:kinetochore protein SPC24 [Tolypothrix sp. FACHB-123]